MDQPRYFEELRIGDRWRSHERKIAESDICRFAELTGDFDPLHVDHEFAQQTSYGRPIAHGLLGLSFLAGLSSSFPSVHTVALVRIDHWEFLLPAFVGDTIHAINEVAELQQTSRRHGNVTWLRQLVNQKGDVVQRGTLETLVATLSGSMRRRSSGRSPAAAVVSRVPK